MQVFAVKQTPSGLLKKVIDIAGNATVQDVLNAANLEKTPEEGLSIFGRRCKPEDPVREGDRVEITAPLLVDPKEARRLRAVNKGNNSPRGRKHAQ